MAVQAGRLVAVASGFRMGGAVVAKWRSVFGAARSDVPMRRTRLGWGLGLAAGLGFGLAAPAGSAQPADPREVLRNLAGCFSVDYRFVEDGTGRDVDIRDALELITLDERGDTLVFQHHGISDGKPVRHFREEWSPGRDGQWTQKVFSPSGTFRYGCSAPFDRAQWKCSAPDAPKPQRDLNRARSDYATLDRSHTVQIAPTVWVQSEVNVKRDANRTAVANEVGWVEYRRLAPTRCQTTP